MGIFSWFGSWFGDREAYQNWAAKHPGWTYHDNYNRLLYLRYQFLEALQLGYDRHADGVFEGQWRNYISKAFTFCYAVRSNYCMGSMVGTHVHRYYRSVVLIHAHRTLPRLLIRRAELLHMIGLHRNPVESQSKEFDRKFVIQTTDPKFAGDSLNERMMRYFLQSQEIGLEANQDVLALYQEGKLQVDSIEPCLEFLSDIASIAS